MKKIDQKIVAYKVINTEVQQEAKDLPSSMDAMVKRPEALRGTTYKIKTPQSEHALYVTINDIVLNEGTTHEKHYPFEIFLNSKNLDSFQWIVALTRVMSGVFRKGGDVTFLVDELKGVFDPKGGYFKKQKYMPSIVSEIGYVLEEHLKGNGHIEREPSAEQKKFMETVLAEKEFELRDKGGEVEFPEHATLCSKCMVKSLVLMDGCVTCLNCGDSKCQ